jgi:transcriptional regulator with XRE-family HTH domain
MITQKPTRTQTQHRASRSYSPLKYQRLLRGWSQQDVVDELYKMCAASGRPDVGISTGRVGEWERGQHKPSPLYRKHLCQLFGLTAAELGFIEPLEGQG